MGIECRGKVLKSSNLEDHWVDGKIKMNCNETGLYMRNSGCNVRQRLLSLRVEPLGYIGRFFKRIYLAYTRRIARPAFRTWEVRTSVGTPAILTVKGNAGVIDQNLLSHYHFHLITHQVSHHPLCTNRYWPRLTINHYAYKSQSSPVTGLEWPRGFQEIKVPRFHDNGTGWW
jgi:hypothetical protein